MLASAGPWTDILEIPLVDDDLIKLAFRFVHNVVFLTLIVRFAWHPNARDREFAFAAVMLNITVFFICFTMKKLELSLGMALGLFAIFGVLRYRTATISTKDMTYLFIVIGIAVVNSLTNKQTSYVELLAVNGMIIIASLVGEALIVRVLRSDAAKEEAEPEKPRRRRRSRRQKIAYDRLDLLAPDRRDELLTDLQARTHLPINRVRIDDIDLTTGSATLSAWHDEATESD